MSGLEVHIWETEAFRWELVSNPFLETTKFLGREMRRELGLELSLGRFNN